MNSWFVAYGFEQLNDIRYTVIECEEDNESQEEILSTLVDMYVNMTDTTDIKKLTISKFVTALFVNAMQIVYRYFKENDKIRVSECIKVMEAMFEYANDLSGSIKDEQSKKTFHVSSYITRCFINQLKKSSKPNNLIELDPFLVDYNIEVGNLEKIIEQNDIVHFF